MFSAAMLTRQEPRDTGASRDLEGHLAVPLEQQDQEEQRGQQDPGE